MQPCDIWIVVHKLLGMFRLPSITKVSSLETVTGSAFEALMFPFLLYASAECNLGNRSVQFTQKTNYVYFLHPSTTIMVNNDEVLAGLINIKIAPFYLTIM